MYHSCTNPHRLHSLAKGLHCLAIVIMSTKPSYSTQPSYASELKRSFIGKNSVKKEIAKDRAPIENGPPQPSKENQKKCCNPYSPPPTTPQFMLLLLVVIIFQFYSSLHSYLLSSLHLYLFVNIAFLFIMNLFPTFYSSYLLSSGGCNSTKTYCQDSAMGGI